MPRIVALLVLMAIAGILVWVAVSDDATEAAAPVPVDPVAAEAPETLPEPPVLAQHGDLVNLQGWLQSDATTLAEAQGKVTIVHFWTFGCFNCKNTIPHLRALYEEYNDDGLEIVGVHAPEFDYERDVSNIEEALGDQNIPWQIALDPDRENFREWQSGGRRFWPRTYVLDNEGNIRFDHIGEGDYEELGQTVASLLADV